MLEHCLAGVVLSDAAKSGASRIGPGKVGLDWAVGMLQAMLVKASIVRVMPSCQIGYRDLLANDKLASITRATQLSCKR